MKLSIPDKYPHPQVKITARCGSWSTVSTVDRSFKEVDVSLPADITEPNVEAFAEFLNGAGEVDESVGKIVLKTRVRSRVPLTKS